ncbi:MAG: hypothetical protein M3Y56_10430 [Armatimonadota bacterium]|nr:hypothetical protein [Armatimonadota bacterium]
MAGLTVALSFLACSTFLIATGHDAAGGLLGTVDIVALVTAFIYGANNRKQERIVKAQVRSELKEQTEKPLPEPKGE